MLRSFLFAVVSLFRSSQQSAIGRSSPRRPLKFKRICRYPSGMEMKNENQKARPFSSPWKMEQCPVVLVAMLKVNVFQLTLHPINITAVE